MIIKRIYVKELMKDDIIVVDDVFYKVCSFSKVSQKNPKRHITVINQNTNNCTDLIYPYEHTVDIFICV